MNFYPDSLGARLLEFNPCHSPEDGKFCSEAGEARIFEDTNPDANLENYERLSTLSPREQLLNRRALRAMPFIHGTSVEGALGAGKHGLYSSRAMEPMRKQFEADVKDLQQEVERVTGKTWREIVDDGVLQFRDYSEETSDLEDEYGLSRGEARELASTLSELNDLQRVIAGTTSDADRALDLDRFVFMTHGAWHQDYGNVGVVIDNKVLDKSGFATPFDIVSNASEVDGRFDEAGVNSYRGTIVRGKDYFKAAGLGHTATGPMNFPAYPFRSREQLWEIKVPRVPPEAVLGYMVRDYDTGLRLRDKLGSAKAKIFVMGDVWEKQTKRFVTRQLRHIQRRGQWDTEAIEKWHDRHDGDLWAVL